MLGERIWLTLGSVRVFGRPESKTPVKFWRNMRKSKLISFFVLLGMLAAMLLFGTLFAHGSIKPRPNRLGVSQFYENPYIYMFGAVTEVTVLTDDTQTYTNVTFQPFGASMLYTQTILFVGTPIDHTGFFIVAYERSAGRVYLGVPAHYVLKAFEVGEAK